MAQTAALIRYDAACRAIAAARATDEVLKIRAQGAMLKAYAKQAKNRELEIAAAEIRMRAERRIGELMQAQKKGGGLAKAGRPIKKIGSARVPISESQPTLAEAGIDKHLADRARKLAAIPSPQFEKAIVDWREQQTPAERITADLARRATANGKLKTTHVAHNSGEIEWYTPGEYIEAARLVMGGIDLDPASSAKANAIVKADRFFSIADDGLAQEWRGRVWMNPPYAPALVREFTAKLVAHVIAHEIEAAIVLVNNATDTQWFRAMADETDAICFKTGRIQFHGPTSGTAVGLQGQAFLYFGADADVFIREFARFGFVMLRANYVSRQFDDESEE